MVSTERGPAYRKLADELNVERRHCRSTMRSMFNSFFGATFLTDTGHESAFSYHIHQYADIYTSKPENFLLHSLDEWLHVPYDIKIMPHHVKVMNSVTLHWAFLCRLSSSQLVVQLVVFLMSCRCHQVYAKCSSNWCLIVQGNLMCALERIVILKSPL